MGFCDFITKAVSTMAIVTGAIVAAPIFGPVGAITAVGSAVAAGIGIAAASADKVSCHK